MVTRSQNSMDINSSRSLFLNTIDIFEDLSHPHDFDRTLTSVDNSFKSTVSSNFSKLQELARNIVNGNSSNLSSSNLKKRVLTKEVNLLEQRHGLGSKRARFSMNSDSSQREAVSDINDPEQFFEAYEQNEKVKSGIKRQKHGVLSVSVLQNTSLTNQPLQTERKELMESKVSDHEFRSVQKENNEVIPAKAKTNVREQRPGLGRRRARFSIKPDSSQRVVNIQPTLDIKNMNDPEEFFKACERNENANKEIRRQMGGILPDSELHTMSVINRPRRPGLLDHNKRRSLYKHLYQSQGLETSCSVAPVHESTDSDIPNVECHDSGGARNCDIVSEGAESPGSMPSEIGKVDEVLDQLLSYNEEELEGDRVIDVLQERLNIKLIELQKLDLPDFPDFPKINLSPATSRKLHFSSIAHMYPKDAPESSISNMASPITQKSPFASFPSLTRRILRSNPSNDLFSAHDDDSESIISRSLEKLRKEFAEAAQKDVSESPLPEVEKNTEIHGTSAIEALDADSSVSHLPGHDCKDINTDNEFACSIPSNHPITADSIDAEPITCSSFEQLYKEFGDAAQNPVTESPLPEVEKNNEIPGTSASKAFDTLDVSSGASPLPGSDYSDINTDNDFAKDQLVSQGNDIEIHVEELHNSNATAQPSLITEDVALNRDSEEHIEENQEQSNTTLDKIGKAKSPLRKAEKKRKAQRRQSLAVPGIGTTWDDGVRKSTRIRVRPLEHWKGERLLFGRIHNSLPTVIGLKYIPSGESRDNLVMQVKSYVGDEYKELVDDAAMH